MVEKDRPVVGKARDLNMKLTQKDVDMLLANPSVDVRSETAKKVSVQYKEETLTDKEKQIAEDIFRLISNDVEIQVREELSDSLKTCSFLPHDIVEKIIQDVASVAMPMIQYSDVLTERDLVEIVKSHDEDKQIAVASRKQVPDKVSEVLIDEAPQAPVIILVSNYGASISEFAYNRLLERFENDETIQRPLLMRPKVPVNVLEKLITKVSDELKRQLLTRRDLPAQLITSLVSQTREKAILTLSEASTEEDVRTLVIHLNGVDRLTPNLILRSVCVGDMKFFEYALAIKAGIPIRNARILIYDSGTLGLERLYEEAELPMDMYPAIRLAVKTFREMLEETEDGYRDHFGRRMVERLLMLFDENKIKLNPADRDYFIQKIGQTGEFYSEVN